MTTPVAEVPPEDQPLTGAFNPNDYDWNSHLKKALEALKVKSLSIERAWNYYDGKHPKVWLTDAIRDQLDDQLTADMAENYCDVAVDAPVKRLNVLGFVNSDDLSVEVQAAKNVWDDNDFDLGQKDIYKEARAVGEAFLFSWKDEEKESGIDATLVDSRQVYWPETSHRSKPERVVRVWADEEEGVWRATCYYKYVVVRLIGPKAKGILEAYPQARYFTIDPEDPGGEHGFEDVPVTRFALEKKRRGVIDQISNLQDKLNKLSANMMVSAEWNAWRKTIIMTEQTVEDDDLKFRPNRALVLHPGGGTDSPAATSIWEGSATELSNYSNEIDKYIDKLFTKAHLPGHMKVKSDNALPSGAAYQADEGPFVEAIKDMQKAFGASWTDFFELTLNAEVKPQWHNPQVRSDADDVTNVKTAVDAGVPLTLALEKYAGWDNDDIKKLEDAPLSPKEQLSMAAAQALADGGMGADANRPPEEKAKAPVPGQPPPQAGGSRSV